MMATLPDEEAAPAAKAFNSYEEEAIVSLLFDYNDFSHTVLPYLQPEMFTNFGAQYAISEMRKVYDEHGSVPTREWVAGNIDVEPLFESVREMILKKSNLRDVPMIKDTLLKWAQKQAYGLVYSDAAKDAYQQGNFEYLQQLIQNAERITDVGSRGFSFFEQYPELFKPETNIHLTTGFSRLDRALNKGGPSPKEVVCYLAPTNVGKCHTLQSKIYVEDLSRIYELETDDGQIISVAGYTGIKTNRGYVRACDLTEEDDILELPASQSWDIEL